jgi:PAS domain-containing protein
MPGARRAAARAGKRPQSVKNAERDSQRLIAALNGMSQGVVMFDDNDRLVLCNERYLQLYDLSPQIVKPGCSLRELIDHRIQRGSFCAEEPEQYVAELMQAIARGESLDDVIDLSNGRTIAISSRRVPGGWVATHEDVTERRQTVKAATIARAQAQAAEEDAEAAHEISRCSGLGAL